MGFNCGIVGLPNVGKSTLFNALTSTQAAQSANYPFCTIEPNVGRVAVPDERLDKLAQIDHSAKIIYTQLEFVDIAGLVKGASKGEGLGNQFLGNIRQTDAIIHLLRCFDNPDITHVEGSINPIRDIEIIDTELMLSDLESLTKRIDGVQKRAKQGDKESAELYPIMRQVLDALENGKPARSVRPNDEDKLKIFNSLFLLTAKPTLYVCNVNEDEAVNGNQYTEMVQQYCQKNGNPMIIISAEIESQIANLEDPVEQKEFLQTIGLEETGLNKLIKSGYELLGLCTYFTSGPTEAHAWTIPIGCSAPKAAGVIHTDFEKGFIRAEVISYNDYIQYGGEVGAKEAGKLRTEGKNYIMQDGDIAHFLFNK